MEGTFLALITVTHAGVPVGTTELHATPRHHSIEPLLPEDLRAQLDRDPVLSVRNFVPLPGYDALRPTLRRAREAMTNMGFLGPAADPRSAERGEAAIEAARAIHQALELRTPDGDLVPARAWLEEWEIEGRQGYSFHALFEDAAALVVARLRPRQGSTGGEEPPAA